MNFLTEGICMVTHAIDKEMIDSFAGGFRGELIQPNDRNYDEAREIYNAMIESNLCVACLSL